ncbi:hypothetical protein [Acidovorax sp.]|uniref:hypothetical protein n=1 Tax=Acidovorax sp. TaxID=1872122 RepID=UPI00391FA0CA
MNPGPWGTHNGKPSITWWRAGDRTLGEPATVEEIVTYESEAARDEAFVHNMKIFARNGALTGTVYSKPSPPRGAVINISLRGPGRQTFRNSVTVDGRDFSVAYAKVVQLLAEHYCVPEGSPIRDAMLASAEAFLKKSGLHLVEVKYLQPAPLAVPTAARERRAGTASPRQRESSVYRETCAA